MAYSSACGSCLFHGVLSGMILIEVFYREPCMKIPANELRSWIASDSLREQLEEFVQDQHVFLSLDEHCTQGGSPGEVELSEFSSELSPDGDFISGDFHVWFSESYYNGCKDLEWSQKHSGSMSYEIDVATGFLRVTDSEITPDSDGDTDDDEGSNEEPGNA